MIAPVPLLIAAGSLGLACLAAVALSAPPVQQHVAATDPRLHREGARWFLADRPYSGEIDEQTADGARSILPLREGLMQGPVRTWYPDGRLRSERLYEGGRKSGPQRQWWPDGRIKLSAIMLADAPVGVLHSWYPSGQRFEEHRYDAAGRESGLQRVWYEDGAQRANYVVLQGRRYGSIGPKGCAGKAALKGGGR